ncbi:hypothetical protein [Sphaerisporangium fuscum]|uniref:hypothetical protein n=1 Tax=Sphaerisporangium fuscum TaxID=2835868 RepID=UPI001BDBE683|nr:hypothetical protein [Sphaerisporangium fuscum]
MTRTTPPRPVDIAAVFPEIAPLARTATRLHPRPGTPDVRSSSIGGPLLWPSDEPWPVCEEPHENEGDFTRLDSERRRRHIFSAAWGRAFTPAERAELDRDEEFADPDTPTTMLAVAQLFLRDVPDLVGPPGADVLQILWCPRDHDPFYCPAVMLRWRRSADVTDVLSEQPEPVVMEYEYLPEPCVLHPEQVVEYPYDEVLADDLRERIRMWEESGEDRYYRELAIADGWKVGGYAGWYLSGPVPLVCECGAEMELLVKIASGEWGGAEIWRPQEDAEEGELPEPPSRSNPPQITIGRGYSLWVFTCPASFKHPHGVSMQ